MILWVMMLRKLVVHVAGKEFRQSRNGNTEGIIAETEQTRIMN